MTAFFKAMLKMASSQEALQKGGLERKIYRLFAGFMVLCVAGCGPLISFGGEPAGETYSLRYPASYEAMGSDGPVIYVDSPQMVEGLGGRSVRVVLHNGQRTVLDGASWSTHLSDLVRDYVSHSLGVGSGANIISEGGLDITAACRLGLKVWAFEFNPGQSAEEDQVTIALQFSLVRMSDSTLLSHPTFSKIVGVSSGSLSSVMEGFSTAMEQAATDYTQWLKGQAPKCSS